MTDYDEIAHALSVILPRPKHSTIIDQATGETSHLYTFNLEDRKNMYMDDQTRRDYTSLLVALQERFPEMDISLRPYNLAAYFTFKREAFQVERYVSRLDLGRNGTYILADHIGELVGAMWASYEVDVATFHYGDYVRFFLEDSTGFHPKGSRGEGYLVDYNPSHNPVYPYVIYGSLKGGNLTSAYFVSKQNMRLLKRPQPLPDED